MVLTAVDGTVFIRYSESALLGMMAYIFLTDMTIGKDQIARWCQHDEPSCCAFSDRPLASL